MDGKECTTSFAKLFLVNMPEGMIQSWHEFVDEILRIHRVIIFAANSCILAVIWCSSLRICMDTDQCKAQSESLSCYPCP